jgi:hypothetical protein
MTAISLLLVGLPLTRTADPFTQQRSLCFFSHLFVLVTNGLFCDALSLGLWGVFVVPCILQEDEEELIFQEEDAGSWFGVSSIKLHIGLSVLPKSFASDAGILFSSACSFI